jgi:hypothetical protein
VRKPKRRKPSFIGLMRRHVQKGEWVTCRDLAARANPTVGGDALTEIAKDYSRRLSNLERYGHVLRRPSGQPNGGSFVYATRDSVDETSPVKTYWFPT